MVMAVGWSAILICIWTTYRLKWMLIDMYKSSNTVIQNYRNRNTIYGMGILFLMVPAILLPVAFFLSPEESNQFSIYVLFLVSLGLIGLLDDFVGKKEIKGFKGHYKAFMNGILTTGMLKAFNGFYVSIVVAMIISKNIFDGIINIMILAFSINFINLMDVRPGRAAKIFTLFSLCFLIYPKSDVTFFLIIGVMITLFVYLPQDLQEIYMMGDTGANILGGVLGINVINGTPLVIKVIYCIGIILIHIAAERCSITHIISKYAFLRYMDNLGRQNS